MNKKYLKEIEKLQSPKNLKKIANRATAYQLKVISKYTKI